MPEYDDRNPLVVFDGICHFCSRSMRIVYSHEKDVPIYFTPTQSELGKGLLAKHGLDPDDPSSFLFLYQGKAWTSSSAVFALAKLLKGWPTLVRLFWIVPRPLTNWVYKTFARNRYNWFGKSKVCLIPTPDMKSRLLDMP
ncbi:MAG: DCC1-like thiol-disulfide oxidoreductase family protein [Robiginitomaculum sp.]|nr:DCC1-like thiol-disulfide oxidoreductase family protein [Robiginitomaculum sp.]